MQSYLQVIITRFVVSFVFLFGALSSNLAQELYEEADIAFNRRGYFEASSDYVAAYAKVKSDLIMKAYCAFQAGECFRLMHDPRGATEWYDKALGLRYANTNPEIYLLYGDALRDQEDFYTAMEWYEKFGENGDRSIADARIEAADIAAIALEEPPSRFIVEPMITVNSPSYDFAPSYASKKHNVLVFASSRESSAGTGEDPITGEAFMDLFTTSQDKKGRWSEPEPLGNTISTVDNEGSATFDKKFKTIYFTRCVDQDGSNLACDIYYAPIMGSNFGASQPLYIVDREQDDSTQIGHPAMSADGDYMVFASDLAGGFGGKDLWFSVFNDDNETWGLPQNLGAAINTSGDEMFPTFRANGALYFSSNGHGGLGGFDLCFADKREGVMAFAEVETLPYPLSSANDELGIIFKGQTNSGILSSNRNGGKGQDDLYEFRLPPMEFCYRAYVYDYDTGMPVDGASITLESSEGGINSYTSDGDGAVELCDGEIEEGVSYEVDVKNEGFIGTGDRFSSIGLTESTTFAREYFLKEIILEKEYDMPLVLYPLGSAELLVNEVVNSTDSLDFLVDLLVRNENLVIQLEAHTDSRGTDSSNKQLSQKRAETCVNFLLDQGISVDRLVPFGHGEEKLIFTDAQIAKLPQSEREDAHQVNRRTVFKIIRFDYIPTEE
jgi:peptidoglycan-associated lipoprotein